MGGLQRPPNPIASINTITTANQAGGAAVTVPATAPLVPTQPWFAQRLYAPTATQIDPTHLSMTFAGYGVQTPGTTCSTTDRSGTWC